MVFVKSIKSITGQGTGKPDFTIGVDILSQALTTLTAQVTQLATVEVDVVSQTIANLTAIVSATALDIRALTSQDIPHQSLPYNFIPLKWINQSGINDEDSDTKVWSVTDWGAGTNFYTMSLCFTMSFGFDSNGGAYSRFDDGFKIELLEIQAVPPHTQILMMNITPLNYPPLKKGSVWHINGTILLNRNKVDMDNTLQLELFNESGIDLNPASVMVFVLGAAV